MLYTRTKNNESGIDFSIAAVFMCCQQVIYDHENHEMARKKSND